ncbi:hypothetical protein MKK75_07545 [Methylobacterium sp. J-030]|uniref:hypothetical protein n=1 Tax=Methylobacterium sp. J-030 TaxID=2836627 RepID=UPI001FBA8526|nr:hypothetical protein [Methylobacterium sp. J-030]MCJ2068655.1 hypothetical protein [Methylobacterium sp. J-030]
MTHALTATRPTPLLRTSLADRLAATRAALTRTTKTPAPSQIHADLLTAYAEQRAVMPLFDLMADSDTPDYRAAFRVEQCLRELLAAVIKAPTPTTLDGLGTLALAMAIDAEGNLNGHRGDCEPEYARAARALVILTRVDLPAGFTGFGDEPDHEAREEALMSGPVSVPAWARTDAA